MVQITLQNASLVDLPVLAEINRQAYMPELTAQIAFTHWPDNENMRVFFTARVKERMLNVNTQVFKAVDTVTGTIAGFVCWTLETGEEEKPGFDEPGLGEPENSKQDPTQYAIQQIPDFLNLDFVLTSGAEIEKLKQLMVGHKHYCKPCCWSPRIQLLTTASCQMYQRLWLHRSIKTKASEQHFCGTVYLSRTRMVFQPG